MQDLVLWFRGELSAVLPDYYTPQLSLKEQVCLSSCHREVGNSPSPLCNASAWVEPVVFPIPARVQRRHIWLKDNAYALARNRCILLIQLATN